MDNFKAYFGRIAEALEQTDSSKLTEIARHISETKKTGRRIFTAGNGGSAATASHLCNDLLKGCRVDDQPGFRASCLADPTAVVTCLANDFSYEEVFSIQLQTFAEKGDLFIMFSGSGNSPNILHAAKTARELGLHVIGFGGCGGGKMKDLCDICLVAPTWCMEELEDLHL